MMTLAHGTGHWGQPLQALTLDREIWTTGVGRGGWAYIEHEGVATVNWGRVNVVLHLPQIGPLAVDDVNAGHGEVAIFTMRGGTNEVPILDQPSYPFIFMNDWWTRPDGTLARKIMFTEAGPMRLQTDLIGPPATGTIAEWVQRSSFGPADQVIGGMTRLIENGQNVVPLLDLDPVSSNGPDPWYVRKNPRVGLGVSENGQHVVIVVAEGRVEGSRGLRLKEFAKFLLDHGCYNATNMDGGGSAHMWVRDIAGRGHGLVADSCYGTSWKDGKPSGDPATWAGIRPNIYATAIL